MAKTDLKVITELSPVPSHNAQVVQFLSDQWGSNMIASRGKLTDAAASSRVLALEPSGVLAGLATFVVDSKNHTCELISIDALIPRQGLGTMLLEAVEAAAIAASCNKVWLITTNTNPEAALFYVRRGYRLVAVHLDALEISRKLKPQIPLTSHGIPLQDEWEFAKSLKSI